MSNVKKLRLFLGIKQVDFAKEMNMSKQVYCNAENAKTKVSQNFEKKALYILLAKLEEKIGSLKEELETCTNLLNEQNELLCNPGTDTQFFEW